MAVKSAHQLAAQLWGDEDIATEADAGSDFVQHRTLARGGAVVLLPGRSRKGAAASVMRWTDGMTLAGVASRLGLAAAIRSGLAGPLMRDRVWIRASAASSGTTLHGHLAEIFEVDSVELSATWGPPRPNRKPILRVFDAGGTTIGFVKVGWNPLTKSLVETESEFLSTAKSGRHLLVPRLIHVGTWRGHLLSITEPCVGRAPKLRSEPPGEDVLKALLGMSPRSRTSLESSSFYKSVVERFNGQLPDDVAAALELATRMSAARELEVGHWHGDWTPWNMITEGGRTTVWDWERTRPHVPVGFDPIHYHFHSGLTHGLRPILALNAAVTKSAPVITQLGVDRGLLPVLAILYSVEMSARFGDGSDGVGWLDGLVAAATDRFGS